MARVKNTMLYDLLEIPCDASTAMIRKQYYSMAMKYHPDKNPNDAHAEEMFKKISEAYQILSDPNLRARYDIMGTEAATPDGGFKNAQDFFRQLFGGEKFVHLIGEISLGKILGDVITEGEEHSGKSTEKSFTLTKDKQDELERTYKERIDMLVCHLIQKTDNYTQGICTGEQFEESIRIEAEDLVKESYGAQLLHSIGYVYLSKARQTLGDYKWFGIPRFVHSVKEKGHILSSLFDTIGAVRQVASMPQAKSTSAANRDDVLLNSDVPTVEQEEKIRHALWKASSFEVETTLRAVCEQFLTVPTRYEREARAKALKLIGKIYSGAEFTPHD